MSATNPYAPGDPRHAAYEAVVIRDVHAFVAGHFASVEDDFIAEGFFGLDAGGSGNPEDWRLRYPTLASYRERWLAQSALFRARLHDGDPAQAIFAVLTVPLLELDGDSGVLLKRFDGVIRPLDGEPIEMRRKSLFLLRQRGARWRVAGFVGYLPL
jgi:hypothetical protein